MNCLKFNWEKCADQHIEVHARELGSTCISCNANCGVCEQCSHQSPLFYFAFAVHGHIMHDECRDPP